MLNFNSITTAIAQETPYHWAFLSNLFSFEDSLELAKSYPQSGFERVGDKSKNFLVLPIVDETKDTIKPYKLNTLWQELINDLCTSAYRLALTSLTGLDLMNDLMYIYFFCYDPESSFPPHPDGDAIRMVQLFYFNQDWDTSWGGCLRILKDESIESLYQEIPPQLNTSVILVKSDNSWHCVTPVTSNSPQSRRILKVAFLKREEFFASKNNT
ncbi:MAG: 2OG-Fe(II) oxygenase [Nostoc sp.]|uniref:2OG-Fe(II) oxygenase n=1 Tax=Nostoc sp. TaxID=1180 RepID=UPI002FFA58B5